jgi:hypothetical protein
VSNLKRTLNRMRVRGSIAAGAVAIATAMLPTASALAETPTPTPESACPRQTLTQPFSSVGDNNLYTLMYGQTEDRFDGSGWTLSGGASIVTATLADGESTTVLDLPSKSQAVSPPICITSDYPRARTMVRNVKGSEGVFFYVSYAGTSTWDTPKNTGQVHGSATAWTLSDPVNLQPYNVAGYQTVRFTLKPGGNSSRFQVYNLYVDPRLRG